VTLGTGNLRPETLEIIRTFARVASACFLLVTAAAAVYAAKTWLRMLVYDRIDKCLSSGQHVKEATLRAISLWGQDLKDPRLQKEIDTAWEAYRQYSAACMVASRYEKRLNMNEAQKVYAVVERLEQMKGATRSASLADDLRKELDIALENMEMVASDRDDSSRIYL
jgi:hypothetical protein